MDQEISFILSFPLIISIGLGSFVLLSITRQRMNPVSRALVVLTIGACIWSFGYLMEFLSLSFGMKLFWAKFEYFGITIIPMAWLFLSFQLMGYPGWFERPLKQRLLLSVLPMLTLVAVWTNELHGLIWRSVRIEAIGEFQVLAFQHGPGFWIYLTYAYILIFIGSVRIIGGLISSFQVSRWRNSLRLVAILIPWLGNLLYVTRINPIPHLDWSPIAFSVAGLLFSISLYRLPQIDILPIAQKTVFEVLPDCMFVLDGSDHLVAANEAAQKTIAGPVAHLLGKSITEVQPELSRWISQASMQELKRAEVTRGSGPDSRAYDLRIIPLLRSNRHPMGRLIICHEITAYKQAQARLEQTRAQLEDTVAERTAELQQAVAQLKTELEQRMLAEKRFEEIIEAAPDAILLFNPAGKVLLVNALTERFFGGSRKELLGKHFLQLVEKGQRRRVRRYVDQFITNPAVSRNRFGQTFNAVRKDGSTFPVEISLSYIQTMDSFWTACIARDISERKEAEEEQKRLLQEVRKSSEHLRALSIRLSEAQEFEQRQIARELHDRIGQSLTGLNLNLQVVKNLITAENYAPIHSRVDDTMDLVEEMTRQLRDVMAELSPPLLEEFGLGPALRFSCQKFTERTGIEVALHGENFQPRLPERAEMALFRIAQEGLNNIARHAQATRVEITLEVTRRVVIFQIRDNGVGFDGSQARGSDGEPHWGLLNMHERAASVGGTFQIESAPGGGTRVIVTLEKGEAHD